jgi:HK97 family phage major capsid protein
VTTTAPKVTPEHIQALRARQEFIAAQEEPSAGQLDEFEGIETLLASLSDGNGNNTLPRQSHPNAGTPLGGAMPTVTTDPAQQNVRALAQKFGITNPTDGGFRTLAEFASCVAQGDTKRLMAAGQNSGTPAQGGYAIPESHALALFGAATEFEDFLPHCQRLAMTAETHIFATIDDRDHSSTTHGGLSPVWAAEADELQLQTCKLRQIRLTASKLAFVVSATSEILADAPGFQQLLETSMAQALGFGRDQAALFGTGAGQPRGVFTDPALIEVSKETNQPANTIVWENVVAMAARLHPSAWRNARWFVSQTALPQLASMSVTIGVSGAFVPAVTSLNGQMTLLGKPITISEKMKPIGDRGDILLADPTQYVFAERLGVRLDRSAHARFSTDEVLFRVVSRCTGQGVWGAPFTPKNGATLGPFVTLAARA